MKVPKPFSPKLVMEQELSRLYNGENDLADFGEEALQAGEQTQAGTEAGGSM